MGSAVLGEAIGAIRHWSVTAKDKSATGADAYGSLVFGDAVQEKRLPKAVYQALRRTITHGEALDPSVADAVAGALKTGPSSTAPRTTRTGSSRSPASPRKSTTPS